MTVRNINSSYEKAIVWKYRDDIIIEYHGKYYKEISGVDDAEFFGRFTLEPKIIPLKERKHLRSVRRGRESRIERTIAAALNMGRKTISLSYGIELLSRAQEPGC